MCCFGCLFCNFFVSIATVVFIKLLWFLVSPHQCSCLFLIFVCIKNSHLWLSLIWEKFSDAKFFALTKLSLFKSFITSLKQQVVSGLIDFSVESCSVLVVACLTLFLNLIFFVVLQSILTTFWRCLLIDMFFYGSPLLWSIEWCWLHLCSTHLCLKALLFAISTCFVCGWARDKVS